MSTSIAAHPPAVKEGRAAMDQADAGVIRVRGARVHNLRDLDVDVPRDRLVVLTGVSGSGKSSLAFDTIYAEGQRRFIEGLSAYARQFLDQLERPDVDLVEGLPPTVAIDQRSGLANPRSTVGTLTEIHDHLRLLYARVGVPHCPRCGRAIVRRSPEQIVEGVLGLSEGRKVIVLAPLIRGKKGLHREAFDAIRRAGLIRGRVDGEMIELGIEPPKLAKTKPHTIEAVVDRIVVRAGVRPRLAESVALALKLGDGTISLSVGQDDGTWEDRTLSTLYACPECGIGLEELEPRTFSFNSPHGACPKCDGLGTITVESKTGTSSQTCPECAGARLRPEARAVTVGGLAIHQLTALNLDRAADWLDALTFEPPEDQVGVPIVREVRSRLEFLRRVGLNYLTLDRSADTLSGGELQRVRLATQIGSGLVGVCYVLDEPTAGLHPRDTEMLITSLVELRDQGNSVLVVEHDEATIRAADWVIDLGPGAGPHGGRITAQGTPEALASMPESVTARYLKREHIDLPPPSGRLERSPGWIEVRGARAHNLKDVDVRFPVGTLCCVTGVSGSGKSSLVLDVLAPAVRQALGHGGPDPGPHDLIAGLERITRMSVIDQAPIGRNPRSTPATYTGLYDEVRRVFAQMRESKVRGYKASRFSFNAKGGRCEVCGGQGTRRIPMQFLPDLFVTCEACRGLRFNPQTLQVRFRGHSIGDVLRLRVEEARSVFESVPRVARGLEALDQAGLGYVELGQSSTTLSGGEAQRVKLAAELGRSDGGSALFLLDEPTTGLHFADVERLLGVLVRLADLGHTLIVIEHNLDIIRAADWVIDLGPEAGERGGTVVAAGPPAVLRDAGESLTGRYLRV